MSIFDDAKQVNFRRIAAAYGLTSDERQQWCLCPFHKDKRPSMKIYDDHAYCFSCNTWTDGIKFVNRLMNKAPNDRAGAESICSTFGLTNRHVSHAIVLENKRKKDEAEKRKKIVDSAYDLMVDYMSLLREWAKSYSPTSFDGEIDGRFVHAVKYLDEVNHYLDLYFQLSEADFYNLVVQLAGAGYFRRIYAVVKSSKR